MKIAVGLSGGVDSAVAALLAKRAGHEVVGVSMKLWQPGRYEGGIGDACFSPSEAEDIAAAETLARQIGIDFHVFDCSREYERLVLDYFRQERAAGRTPNPCVVCNRNIKFGLLPRLAAEKIGFDRFATGHYARAVRHGERHAIARAVDAGKDQSYFLWGLSQEQIGQIAFPLGSLSKADVRAIAREANLPMAEKADSQDFYSGDTNELLGTSDRPGDIVATDGKILGRHNGYWHYTVGQRQGLGIGGGVPFYVIRTDPCRNEVVVGRRDEAFGRAFSIDSINWQAAAPGSEPVKGFLKIRSSGRPAGPVVLEHDTVTSSCDLFGIAPGQSAVVYDEEGNILCGGVIARRLPAGRDDARE